MKMADDQFCLKNTRKEVGGRMGLSALRGPLNYLK